ncbi:MAG: hypothetical protein A3J93_04550 [Candidatus Magasanikbacteria bacterium RIFOXYC2_FULL_42_28]|uniref:Uncharacterized protein n=1 Tax=Candidatus Magasanikbacteria bacterium RIFOXYC2_FULL_42_28 TaxID=1798704 RepID=A0A1F6NX65_9BACT|nr:MAG: hypothetical protein A3J93_04550 [Candidatus Magasanikbacteria bacterium RIFOXYC2_FULL_42_28]
MVNIKKYLTIENLGLFFGMIGSVTIALALGELPCGGKDGGGVSGCFKATGTLTEYPIVYFLSKTKFYTGIFLLFLAFVLQIKPIKK